eukprot:scaffold28215_cov13-Tisochrysis_lutea.AAC.2
MPGYGSTAVRAGGAQSKCKKGHTDDEEQAQPQQQQSQQQQWLSSERGGLEGPEILGMGLALAVKQSWYLFYIQSIQLSCLEHSK